MKENKNQFPTIVESTSSYEAWLGRQMPLLLDDIALKHQKMTESSFMFLRATYYRWVQHWDHSCQELSDFPTVLAVGDVHFENFGTWRDCDGRLIWGLNDFDEAAQLPGVFDVVRLGASICMAIGEGSLVIDRETMIDALIEGYIEHGTSTGGAFVLEENHAWLRKIALSKLRDPVRFWRKFENLPRAEQKPFLAARRALTTALPAKSLETEFLRRTAGLGSLGRPRVAAVARWGNGFICREAKHVAPPASYWARGNTSQKQVNISAIARRTSRVPDPFFHVSGKWIIRRLSPHCCKIDMSTLYRDKSVLKLVGAMSGALANIHRASLDPKILSREMRARKSHVRKAILKMTKLTYQDWRDWQKAYKKMQRAEAKAAKSRKA